MLFCLLVFFVWYIKKRERRRKGNLDRVGVEGVAFGRHLRQSLDFASFRSQFQEIGLWLVGTGLVLPSSVEGFWHVGQHHLPDQSLRPSLHYQSNKGNEKNRTRKEIYISVHVSLLCVVLRW